MTDQPCATWERIVDTERPGASHPLGRRKRAPDRKARRRIQPTPLRVPPWEVYDPDDSATWHDAPCGTDAELDDDEHQGDEDRARRAPYQREVRRRAA